MVYFPAVATIKVEYSYLHKLMLEGRKRKKKKKTIMVVDSWKMTMNSDNNMDAFLS